MPRDIDDKLRGLLAQGKFVLLVADSAAGKTRTAYEAALATLPDHVLIYPNSRADWNNLALALEGLGRLDEAEREHRTMLEIARRVLGHDEHPDILESVAALVQARERLR